MARHYLIRRSAWLRPLLWLVGFARDANSYVAIEDGILHARFGWFFDNSFQLDAVESVSESRWPWYYGLGWRSNLAGLVGLVASFEGTVEVQFKERQRVGGIIPFLKIPCNRLAVSLEEPQSFITELRRSIQ